MSKEESFNISGKINLTNNSKHKIISNKKPLDLANQKKFITDQIKKREVKDKIDKKNVIKKIQGETEEKERIFVYLSSDLVFKVKEYGKQIGRTAGGNSRIVAEALKEYFKRHNL